MKAKRILALLGIVILVGIYAASLLFAFLDHPLKVSMMYAALYATFIVPVLFYAFILVAKLLHKDDEESTPTA